VKSLIIKITYELFIFALVYGINTAIHCQTIEQPLTVQPSQISESPPEAPTVYEIYLAEGLGGYNRAAVRNYDAEARYPRNGTIYQKQFSHTNQLQVIGGGGNRAMYVSVEKSTVHFNPLVAITFGLINEPAGYPNIVFPMQRNVTGIYGHPFSAFPSGTNHVINYDLGELRTVIGDFVEDGKNLLAVAQGFGSKNGLVRLFEYTGKPAPYGWVSGGCGWRWQG
jgi:hypothetical protein